jgi:hypothetical protein
MKRIGNKASGGTVERTEITGAKVVPATGSNPVMTPTTSAIDVEIARPVRRCVRLAPCILPERIITGACI